MDKIHHIWRLFCSSFCPGLVVLTDTEWLEMEGDVKTSEACLLLKANPAKGPSTGYSNDSVTLFVDRGLSGHHFDNTIFPKLGGGLGNNQVKIVQRFSYINHKGMLHR